MTSFVTQQSLRQGHKYTDSTDSETSFFDPTSSTSPTTDSWSGYFEGWDNRKLESRDNYCPQIMSPSNSPARSSSSDKTQICDSQDLLPSARPIDTRPPSIRRDAAEPVKSPRSSKRTTKRYGIVPYADPQAGDSAVIRLHRLLHDTMSDTEDILAAMYDPNWDATSLQKWYQQTQQSPSDLALFKIMFSLRFTRDEPSPLPT